MVVSGAKAPRSLFLYFSPTSGVLYGSGSLCFPPPHSAPVFSGSHSDADGEG